MFNCTKIHKALACKTLLHPTTCSCNRCITAWRFNDKAFFSHVNHPSLLLQSLGQILLTPEYVQVDGRLHGVGRDAPVDARVRVVRPLDEEVAGGGVVLLDHQGHAAAGGVVADHLEVRHGEGSVSIIIIIITIIIIIIIITIIIIIIITIIIIIITIIIIAIIIIIISIITISIITISIITISIITISIITISIIIISIITISIIIIIIITISIIIIVLIVT